MNDLPSGNKNLPSVLYLDTNIIRNINHPSYFELKNLCEQLSIPIKIPGVVFLEWLNDHIEDIIKKTNQTIKNLEYLDKVLFDKKSKGYELPNEYTKKIVAYLNTRLSDLGIRKAPTPEDLRVNDIAFRAAFKFRPFEEKGEKGFMDTVILHTIANDLKKNNLNGGLLISTDNIFDHEDIKVFCNEEKIKLQFKTSFEETSIFIKNILNEKQRADYELKKQKLMQFLKSKQDYIFKFTKENAEITEDFITKGGFFSKKIDISGRIEKIRSFEPIEIVSAIDDLISLKKDGKYSENKGPVLISVKIKLLIIYSPWLLFNQPRIKSQDFERFREVINSIPIRYYADPIEKEIEREILLRAIVQKDKENNYTNLTLQTAMTL